MTEEKSAAFKGEHSDRGRYVTDQVKLWITNDGDHYERVLSFITTERSMAGMSDYLVRVIRSAPPHSAPWHVAQELAPNDYARINWYDVAEELKGE